MIQTIKLSTRIRTELVDITSAVRAKVRDSRIKSGICHIFVPHTTAGLIINENADPSVRRDILQWLDRAAPFEGDYEHAEGNSAAHIKSSLVGSEKTIFIEDGDLALGTWQGIFFCEFDGPRQRNVMIRITER
jgi:secondary thiamine-phosphate synthase enzyme